MSVKRWALPIFLSILALIGFTYYYEWEQTQVDDEAPVIAAKDQSKEFGLSGIKTVSGNPIEAHQLADSQSCASCHQVSFEEWKVSAHARSAVNDPIYENHEETFAVPDLGQDNITFCASCHTPEAVVTGSIGATKWTSAKYEQAGTSCIICHSIGAVYNNDKQGVPADGSFILTPERVNPYPFDKETVQALRDYLIRAAPKRHAADLSSKLYREAQYCSTCHTQAAPNGKIEQDTYREWLNSPYGKQGTKDFATCITCHMAVVPGEPKQTVSGQTTNGGKVKEKVLSHYFVGANQALPHFYGDKKLFDLTEKMLRSAAEIEIVEVAPNDDQLNFKVKVTNKGAGHNLPTGATDLRQLWIDVEVLDSQGKVLFTSGKLDDKMEIKPNSVIFNSKFYDKDGKLIDHHQVWRIERREDNLIPPKESRYGDYSFALPKDVKQVTIKSKLRYRISPQYFANVTLRNFGEPGSDRILPITDIDVKEKVISLD